MDLNSVSKSKRGGRRPGAGRPRLISSKEQTLTKEETIESLERKLRDPNCSSRDATSLTRKIALLRKWETPYDRNAAKQLEPPPDPEELPKWWSEDWVRVFISERARGVVGGCRWRRELDQFEAEWAKQEGLSVDQLREAPPLRGC
jgi:hypothetical protein